MASRYSELVQKLKEIFQLDQPELDFGIYRILHARADKISDFLENRLKQKVQESLREQPEAEGDVYSHLLKFFSRYYDKGDFISLRRYKGDTYAIPYSGEEVKLHWANADQYYIKSSEAFSNYSFSLDNGKKVHFKLLAADTAKDNTKDNDGVRRFVLWEPRESCDDDAPAHLLEEKDDGLYIYFRYVKLPKKPDDETKNSLKPEAMRLRIEQDFHTLGISAVYEPLFTTLAPTEKDKKRSLLEKHLSNYIAKNTSDYFIHKNLGAFLRNELDFYIKNEMMHLDDIMDASTIDDIGSNLRKIQTVRTIASELITFMAQLEDFQKKLWLKKKFVVQCDYCVTMDMIPQELRAEVLANPLQLEEWKRLNTEEASLLIDARMVDTRFFDEDFKARLLTSIDNLDERCDGVIIHSENFGALNLIKKKYAGKFDAIYIDPPYNTGNDGFLYKDAYQHSSWISMIEDRLALGRVFCSKSGAILASIDETEFVNLHKAFDITWGSDNHIADFVWAAGRKNDSRYVSVSHEYMVCYAYSKTHLDETKTTWRQRKEGLDQIYKIYNKLKKQYKDDYSTIEKELKQWYKELPKSSPAKAHDHYKRVDEKGIFFPDNISWPGGGGPKYEVIHPITGKPVKTPSRGWVYSTPEKMKEMIEEGLVVFGEDENKVPCIKSYLINNEYSAPYSVIYQDGRAATKRLRAILGINDFGYPKDENVVSETLSSWTNDQSVFLDYFAGSGTTAHGVISMNRKDAGHRKYVLVEMGDHADKIIRPRLKKVVYSPTWKDGKPECHDKGISHCFKYMRLESYEDTLNNIRKPDDNKDQDGEKFDFFDKLEDETMKEEYLLKYMLDIDSRGALINVNSFKKPFDYKLRIAVDSSGAFENRKIDLVETFNYLIGLKVEWQHRRMDKGYVFVEGILPDGGRALVVWRDCEKVDNDRLNELIFGRFSGFDKLANDYSVIYVNGDHSIRNRKLGDEEDGYELKIRSLEREFLTRMFEEE